jgi:hypothetical protein
VGVMGVGGVLWTSDEGRAFGCAAKEVGGREAAMADRRALGGAMPEKTWTGRRRGRTMGSGFGGVSFCGSCVIVLVLVGDDGRSMP